MPDPRDEKFAPIDARFTGSRPVSEVMSGNPVMDYLRRRIQPRGPERTEILPGEIVLEVDVHQESLFRRDWHDIFIDRWQSGMETVLSGNGPLYWQAGGPEYLRSRFDFLRSGSKGPEDTREMFRSFGAIPGWALCLDRELKRGRIIDLFGLKEYEEQWEHLRRLAVTLSNPIFINPPGIEQAGAEYVVNFKTASDLASWEWEMRKAMDNTIDTAECKRHVVRGFQNAHQLRTREELVRSGQVRMKFANSAQEFQLRRDMEAREKLCRAGKLAGNPEDYEYHGFMTPALAGMAEVDLVTYVGGLKD